MLINVQKRNLKKKLAVNESNQRKRKDGVRKSRRSDVGKEING